ncbi:MAG TPA: RHS repeat-associated core domain-containing protein, partial [Thermoanaerobaculia bacterium]
NAQAAAAGPAFPGGQALGWHGHWTDPVTGLIYMRHRWYDPRTGTFLSPDPLEDIDSPNQYLFGAGRPHEVVDPLGLAVTVKAEVPGAPCNVLPSVDMETGRYPVLDAALLGPISSLENAGRKAVNTILNASCAVGAGVDRADEKLWEKGVLCRGCLTFGVDLGFSLWGTAEGLLARDVGSVYSRGLSPRTPPSAPVPVRNADTPSVWSKGPGPRGILIEDAIESSGLRSGRLPKGFRGVDFHEGTVTSVKSLDLGAASYQKPEKVLSTVKGYVDSLHEFTGGSLQGRVIRPADITGRQLDLVVPPASPTAAQRLALDEAKRYAAQKNIVLNVFSVE